MNEQPQDDRVIILDRGETMTVAPADGWYWVSGGKDPCYLRKGDPIPRPEHVRAAVRKLK